MSWSAPPECPSGDTVRQRIDRLLGAPVESKVAQPLDVRGTITATPTGMELRLETNDNGLRGVRTIAGTQCDELSSAGALVVALAIDPAAVAAHGGAPSASFSDAGAASAANRPSVAPVTAAPPAAVAAAPFPRVEPLPTAPPASATRGVVDFKSILDVGSVSHQPSIGAELGVGFATGHFLVRLGATYFPSRFAAVSGEPRKGADISVVASDLAGCFISRDGTLGLSACGVIETGVFLATGSGFLSTESTNSLWFAPGADFGASVALAKAVSLEASLGARVPGKGPEVRYTPADAAPGETSEIYRPWPVVLRIGLGLGLTLE